MGRDVGGIMRRRTLCYNDKIKHNRAPIQPKKVLRRLYVKKKVPAARIAEMFDVHRETVRSWLVYYGFKIRQTHEYDTIYNHPIPKKEELEYWYKVRKLSRESIGEKYGVAGRTVHEWLVKYNLMKHRVKMPDKEDLLYWYEEYKKDAKPKQLKEVYQKLAERYGAAPRTIYDWLAKIKKGL